jgi:hypothetical protein
LKRKPTTKASAAPRQRAGIVFRAKARAFSYQPFGEAIASKITLPTPPFFDTARAALEHINHLHGDGPLPAISVREEQLNEPAAYEYDTQTGRALGILLSGDYTELEVIHEIGHFLDHWGLARGQFASETNEALHDWREAVRASSAYRTLEALQGVTETTIEVFDEHFILPVSQQDVRYFLRWRECFARSYAQYVAVSSGNPTLRRQIGENAPNEHREVLYTSQWADRDFAPIAETLDALFVRLQWLR